MSTRPTAWNAQHRSVRSFGLDVPHGQAIYHYGGSRSRCALAIDGFLNSDGGVWGSYGERGAARDSGHRGADRRLSGCYPRRQAGVAIVATGVFDEDQTAVELRCLVAFELPRLHQADGSRMRKATLPTSVAI